MKKLFMILMICSMLIVSCSTTPVTKYVVPTYSEIVIPPVKPVFPMITNDENALRTTGIYLSTALAGIAERDIYIKDIEGFYLQAIKIITR